SREAERFGRERDAADEELRSERAEHLRMLSTLLPVDREKTDQHLLTERSHADEAIANRADFLSIVSHDLRNLLSTVGMGAQVIARNASQDGPENSTFVTA